MIRLLTAVFLFASFHVVAEVTLTDINNNEVADADEVMGNFNALKQGVEANATAIDALPTPPTDCTTKQIIKWNGTAWACADDPLANLSCGSGDTLTYNGSWFTCDCVPPGAPITDSNFYAAINDWFAVGKGSQYGDIRQWCTGAVTNMAAAFHDRTDFNADISGWDTSNVISMEAMFYNARTFNRDISGWDTSNVITMRDMFYNARAFNQPIGDWDTSYVTNMRGMFYYAEAFNQPIGDWNVSNVTNMYGMFDKALTFNWPIDDWNVTSVLDMTLMFWAAEAFNQDLSNWDASSVQNCAAFANFADAWLDQYGGSIAGKTPPLSASLIAAGCGE